MRTRRQTQARLLYAIISVLLEEFVIWAVWNWVLPLLDIRTDYRVLIIVMVLFALFSAWLFRVGSKALQTDPQAGLPSMVRMRGKAVGSLAPRGMVKIKGELWDAAAPDGDVIKTGEEVVVTGQYGLKLVVEKVVKGIGSRE